MLAVRKAAILIGLAAVLQAAVLIALSSMRHRVVYGPKIQNESVRAFLISHRSCSQDPNAMCNRQMMKDLTRLSDVAQAYPFAGHFLYHGLPSDIWNDPKWKDHVSFDNSRYQARGRGYWFWKAALTNRLLKRGEISDGDIIVWIDADTMPDRLGKYEEWVEVLAGNFQEDFFMRDQPRNLPREERMWTKGDIYEEFNVSFESPQYGASRQASANFWLLRVNKRTRELISKWENLASNFHLISDEKSKAPNYPKFRENRHDQSLISMLLKASMIRIVEPEQEPEEWDPEATLGGPEAMDPDAEEPEAWKRWRPRSRPGSPRSPRRNEPEEEEALQAEEPAREPRALAEYQQDINPKFGVRDLSAIQGELHNLITQPISGKSSNVNSTLPPANRWMCIGDECHDLMVQPKGFVPRGVGHKV